MKSTLLLALLASLAVLALLAPVVRADQLSVDLDAEVEQWMEVEGADDGLAQMLLEAEADLATSNKLAGASDADSEAESEMEVDSENERGRFGQLVARARAKAAAAAPVAAGPAKRPGLLGRIAAGVKKTAGGVKRSLQRVLAKSPKLRAIGAKIGNKLKSVSADIKATLRAALAKAKSPAERQKAILAAKNAARKAKKAAVRVAKKAATKVNVLANKVTAGIKKAKMAARAKKAAKKIAKKLTKAERRAHRLARKAARKARRLARKKAPPRSNSKRARDANGRFRDRYRRPVHQKGKLKGKVKARKHMTKKERKAFKLQKKLSKLAHKALKAAQKKKKVSKADFLFAKAKLKEFRKAAKKVAKKAAKEVKRIHRLRQAAAMGGPKAAAELAAAQIVAAKLQKDAIEAQGTFRTQKNKVKTLRVALKAQSKAVYNARANIHENGFDELLNKVDADVKKLDTSLFGKKQPNMKGYRTLLKSVEVPSQRYPGSWERKDLNIVEKIPTRKIPVLKELNVPDPSRPGFTTRKLTQTFRVVPSNLPTATRPVTILTKKEKRPFIGPGGKVFPVEVTYQVATQTVRAKSNGRTPQGFVQQEVIPPPESGLVYKEVTRRFPTLINGHIRNLPMKVSTWSKSSIQLKDVNGRSVASLKTKEVKAGASPISIKPLRSQPRKLDGKWVISVIKQVPVKTRRGLMLKNQVIDIPASDDVVAGGSPKFNVIRSKYKPQKTKLKVVLEGVDNSLAQQQARKVALEAVEEDIQDNAINGSISERHLKAGLKAHAEADRVRENFYPFQDKLALKSLIRPEHRFID